MRLLRRLLALLAALSSGHPLAPGDGGKVREMGPAEHTCDVDRECSEDWEPRHDMFRAAWMHPMLSDEDAKKASAADVKNNGPPKCVSPGCVTGTCSYGYSCCTTKRADYEAVRANWVKALASRLKEARDKYPPQQRPHVPLPQLLPNSLSESSTACGPGGCELWPHAGIHGVGMGSGQDFERRSTGAQGASRAPAPAPAPAPATLARPADARTEKPRLPGYMFRRARSLSSK